MVAAQAPDDCDQTDENVLRNRKAAHASSKRAEATSEEPAEQSKAVLEAEAIPRVHKHRQQNMCTRLMRSTPFKLLTLSVVGIVPTFGAFIALPRLLEMMEAGIALSCFHWTITIWIIIQVMYNFAMSQFTDPGRTTNYKPTYETTGQYMLAPEVDSEDESTRIWYAPNYCSKCQHWKPPRAHHCGMCGRCVLRMDHHCPFTGNCIGFRNHGHFAIMYLFAFIGLVYSAAMCINPIVRNWMSGNVINHGLRLHKLVPFQNVILIWYITELATFILDHGGAHAFFLLVLTVIFLLAVLGCGCPALQMFAYNATMIELRFPMKDYVQIKPQVYCPLGVGFYRHDVLQNVQYLLGKNWRWRLLLPIRGLLDESERGPAIMPLPAPVGISQLREKVQQVEDEGVKSHSTFAELGINRGPAALEADAAAERSVAEDVAESKE
eukprot:TRINITY_DN24922_c0_g1_i1.p1 TRINITY_DN24922_c0_g1~~TRINITY_DN24922_c0_g1_i1.p1  ORF type:complete len:437 (+),score=60.38 TRINITY_DN24922_c0_g1_i1:38-1348(+)